jgi:hypothetical protein
MSLRDEAQARGEEGSWQGEDGSRIRSGDFAPWSAQAT